MTSAKVYILLFLLLVKAVTVMSSASPAPLFGLFNKKPGGPGGQFGGPPNRRAYGGFGQGGFGQGGGFSQDGGFGQGGYGPRRGGPGGFRY